MSDIPGCRPTVLLCQQKSLSLLTPPAGVSASQSLIWGKGEPGPPHSLIRTSWGLGGWPAAASGTGVRTLWKEEESGGGQARKRKEPRSTGRWTHGRRSPSSERPLRRNTSPPGPQEGSTMEAAHSKSTEECLSFFGVSETTGLTPDQVKRHLEKYGPNGKF